MNRPGSELAAEFSGQGAQTEEQPTSTIEWCPTLKITGRQKAQLFDGPVDCDVRH